MGIRYDRDSRRATNGPLIFFSMVKDPAFEMEINSAFLSGLSFYAYRGPDDSMMSFGSSEGYVEGLGIPGFVIGFFSPELPIITIPYSGVKKREKSNSLYTMPQSSTTFEEYSREVEQIITDIHQGEGQKVVAARVIVNEETMDVAEKFYELCDRFPEAFVFCFGTPATGCWIGASPELLLEGKEKELRTMALAGTRSAYSPAPWDIKNIEEQRYVADYILDVFQKSGLNSEEEETFTRVAGNIEHICTPIKCDLKEKKICIPGLLRELSPTPALCGLPKEFGLREIARLENFERGCYGGFCGPYHSDSDFHFNVVLRCASVNEKRYCVYAGGGITAKSDVREEWAETEAKAIHCV